MSRGKLLAGRSSVLVHPASYYVGLFDQDSSFPVDVGKVFGCRRCSHCPVGQASAWPHREFLELI